MLDVFLEVGVDLAVGGPDVVGEPAHAVDVCTAEEEGHRHDQEDYEGESPVHGSEEDEGCDKLDGCRYDGGQGTREGVRHFGDVAVETAEHVSGMECFLTKPAAFHDLGEVPVSQGVSHGYVGPCLETADHYGEEYLEDRAGCEDCDMDIEVAVGGIGRDVDKSLADPYVYHRHCDRHGADEGDGKDAGPVAFGDMQEPT